MAITKMNKFTLICLSRDKKRVTSALQRFGNAELINLQTKSDEDEGLKCLSKDKMSSELQEIESSLVGLKSVIGVLDEYVKKESAINSLRNGCREVSFEDFKLSVLENIENTKNIVSSVRAQDEKRNLLHSERLSLKEKIDGLMPWISLNSSLGEVSKARNVVTYTVSIPINLFDELSAELSIKELVDYSEVSRDGKRVYILIVSHLMQKDELMESLRRFDFVECQIDKEMSPSMQLDKCQSRLAEIQNEEDSIRENLCKYAEQINLLKEYEEYCENEKERLFSNVNFLVTQKTIVMSGWVPVEENDSLVKSLEEATNNTSVLGFEEVSEEEDLEVPVKLKNNSFFTPFESITEMYSLPNYKGLDPTPMLAPFYMAFFGMMVGDFGYGAIIVIACLMALKLFNLDDSSKNFVKLFTWLGVATTAWGLIYGAGFGDKIQFDSLLNMNNDIMTIMGLSIGFGVFQILVALGIKAYMCIRAKQYFAAFADVGLWVISFVGIAMFALDVPFGGFVMAFGMIGIVLTNGRDANGTAGKIASGAYALYGITNYVGDLVSYTRLMALGVAGGSIATAMNLIIGYLPSNIITTLLIVPVLFVAVHIFNLLLGALGAYVHSCRLQYVEYFGKFYDGGGKAFKPFRFKNINMKVK